MKFTEHLQAHLTPEWRKQYIRYEDMKHMLYAKEKEYTEGGFSQAEQERFLINFDEEFFNFCDAELIKINTFFAEKLAEAIRKLATLKFELSVFIEAAASAQQEKLVANRKKNSWADGNTKQQQNRPLPTSVTSATLNSAQNWIKWVTPGTGSVKNRKAQDLKLAFSEFYLSLVLLQNYQQLNYTGFRKILKKHDKLFSTDAGNKWRIQYIDNAPFYTNQDINNFIQEIELLYTNNLVAGDRTKAMKRLRVPPLSEQKSLWTSFRLGLFLGIFCVLCVVIIMSAIFTDHKKDWRPAVRIFRGAFLVVLFTYLLGINTYGWQSAGVNHVLIFEIDPRNHLTDQQILEIASILGVIWAMAVLVYIFSEALRIPALLSPLVLVALYLLFLLNPTPTLYYRSRFWLLRILWRICNAPFYHVGFADFWLADQLNSLVIVFLDFEYLFCFYAIEVDWLPDRKTGVCFTNSYGIRPVIAMLPAWFRFFQCLRRYRDSKEAFPHLVNAGKYSTTFFVVLFSTLSTFHEEGTIAYQAAFYCWIASAIVSSLYAYAWDIKRDWGLLDSSGGGGCVGGGENRFLREQLVYTRKSYYYLAMIEDIVLRFAWTLTVSVGKEKLLESDILISILAPLEVFRRFVWNFFRLENEHLNNCGQFRAVRDISIAPIDKNDLALLERMMDEDDGVDNRGRSHGLTRTASQPSHHHHHHLKFNFSKKDFLTLGGIGGNTSAHKSRNDDGDDDHITMDMTDHPDYTDTVTSDIFRQIAASDIDVSAKLTKKAQQQAPTHQRTSIDSLSRLLNFGSSVKKDKNAKKQPKFSLVELGIIHDDVKPTRTGTIMSEDNRMITIQPSQSKRYSSDTRQLTMRHVSPQNQDISENPEKSTNNSNNNSDRRTPLG